MDRLLETMKFFVVKKKNSKNHFIFSAYTHQEPGSDKFPRGHRIAGAGLEDFGALALMDVVSLSKKYQKKYEGHGIGTALTMLEFLFSFCEFGCLTIKTSLMSKGRKGEMYTLLGMKRKFRLHPLLYLTWILPSSKTTPVYFKIKYEKKAVRIIQENGMVQLLCKQLAGNGLSFDEIIRTYKDVAEDLSHYGFLEQGNTLGKAADELEKKIF